MGLNAVYIEVVSGGRIHSGEKKTLLHCYSVTGREGLSQFIYLLKTEFLERKRQTKVIVLKIV